MDGVGVTQRQVPGHTTHPSHTSLIHCQGAGRGNQVIHPWPHYTSMANQPFAPACFYSPLQPPSPLIFPYTPNLSQASHHPDSMSPTQPLSPSTLVTPCGQVTQHVKRIGDSQTWRTISTFTFHPQVATCSLAAHLSPPGGDQGDLRGHQRPVPQAQGVPAPGGGAGWRDPQLALRSESGSGRGWR